MRSSAWDGENATPSVKDIATASTAVIWSPLPVGLRISKCPETGKATSRYHTECCVATGQRKKANQLTALVFLLPVDVIRSGVEEPLRYPLLLAAALSPGDSNERVSLFAHDFLQHDANGSAGQVAQILLKFLLPGQSRGSLPLW